MTRSDNNKYLLTYFYNGDPGGVWKRGEWKEIKRREENGRSEKEETKKRGGGLLFVSSLYFLFFLVYCSI